MTNCLAVDTRPAQPRVAPGPRGSRFLGVLPELRGNPLQFAVKTAQTFGSVARLPLGTQSLFMVNHPDLVAHVLHENGPNYRKSRFYEKLVPFFGEGLITSNGTVWREQRQVCQPAFSGPNLRLMVKDMAALAGAMIDRWSEAEGPIEITGEFMRLNLAIALKTLFSATLHEEEVGRLQGALTTLLRVAEKRLWGMTSLAEHLPLPENFAFRRAVKVLDEIVYRIIRERRQRREPASDLFQLLLDARDSAGKAFGDKWLRDQIASILTAGYETNACAFAWTSCLLSKHSDVERHLHREVAEVLGGRSPTFDDLSKLSYAKMVFHESMRLYPPIWTISREAIEADEIGGYHVPAGSAVMISPYAMHRDRRFWENPEGFDPDRFSPERERDRPRYAYLPFGGGQRNCIGNRFALLEALVVLSMVLQRFRLDLVPGQRIDPEPMISLRPRYGMLVTLYRREEAESDHARLTASGRVPAAVPSVRHSCPIHSGLTPVPAEN